MSYRRLVHAVRVAVAGAAGRYTRWVALILATGLAVGLLPVLIGIARSGGDLVFKRDGYQLWSISAVGTPNNVKRAPLLDKGLHDAEGVRMFRWRDRDRDHPVAQAQFGLQNLASWRATEDRRYLDRAIVNAQRNLDRHVESRDAWWYPYDFDLPRCKKRPLLKAKWYSGMSQGLLLSLFVGLFQETGDATWKTAADKTFLSLTLAPDDTVPWATWTDKNGYLWLEEYPESDAPRGERVLNGHIFSLFGIYDYWRITKDPRAAELFDGAASTVRRYLPTNFRVENWASRYSVECTHFHPLYHQIHTAQTLKLYELTHAPVFAEYADTLRSDYPAPAVDGTVHFAAGTHVGYMFDRAGAVTGQKSVTLDEPSRAHANQRSRVRGKGIYYRISHGPLAGYLVPEAYGQRVLLGKAVEHRYSPTRVLAIQPGSYTAYAYGGAGKVVGTKQADVVAASYLSVGASAWVNGRLSYQVTAGDLAGYWLAHTSGLAFT